MVTIYGSVDRALSVFTTYDGRLSFGIYPSEFPRSRHDAIVELPVGAGDETQGLPEQMAAFGITAPVREGVQRLFLSHPAIEARIAALQEQSPSRDQGLRLLGQ